MWKGMRSCFRRWRLKCKTKSGQGRKFVKEYKYSKQLEFLLPFMQMNNTSTNIDYTSDSGDSDNDADWVEDTQGSTIPNISLPIPKTSESQNGSSTPDAALPSCANSGPSAHWKPISKKQKKVDPVDEEILKFLKEKSNKDDTDHFFLAMSNSVKKMPESSQRKLKFEIHEIVFKEEKRIAEN